MRWIKDKSLVIFVIFINIIFALNLTRKILLIENFNNLYVIMLFFISVFIYWLFDYVLKIKKVKSILKVTAFIIIPICLFKSQYLIMSIINFISDNYVNNFKLLYDLISQFKVTYFYQYKYFLILIFVVVVPILTAIVFKYNNLILILNFIYVVSMWFLNYTDIIIDYMWFYLCTTMISCGAFVYNKRIKEFRENNIDVNINKIHILVCSSIFIMIVILCSSLLPQNIKGKYSSNLKTKFINKFAPKNTQYKLKDKAYDLKSSGYINNDRRLGGPIKLNDKVAFKIKGDSIKYLKGSVKDYYDGHVWTKSSYLELWKANLLNPTVNYDKIHKVIKEDYKHKITIYPENLKTTSLLVPFNPYYIKGSEGSIYYDAIPTFLSDTVQTKSYTVYYDPAAFETYEELKQNVLSVPSSFENIEMFKYSNYLQIPNELPQRIYELVYNITKDCVSNIEKEERIIAYLEKNYAYSTNMSNVPDDRDFVDYFLFDEKKGYCTYFASAASIMFRIAGIPSRYVEGFKISDNINEEEYIEVTNEQAHAWCEILVQPDKDIWCVVDPYYSSEEVQNSQINSEYEDYSQDMNAVFNNQIKRKNLLMEEMMKERQLNDADEKKNIINIIKNVFAVVVCFICFAVIIKFLIYKIKKKKILNSNSIIPLYINTLKRLESINIYKKDYLGDMEFALEIKDNDLRKKLVNIVKIYYNEYYGNKNENSFDKNDFYKFIEEYIKNRKNKLKYYLELILL